MKRVDQDRQIFVRTYSAYIKEEGIALTEPVPREHFSPIVAWFCHSEDRLSGFGNNSQTRVRKIEMFYDLGFRIMRDRGDQRCLPDRKPLFKPPQLS